MDLLEAYLRELVDIRRSGAAVKETSYYGALSNLLNAVGKMLKPGVRCVLNIQNRGAGLPDGGFFTAEQLDRGPGLEPSTGQIPARGAMEVKGTEADVHKVVRAEQVQRYLDRYGQVLVTNYRDFVLAGRGIDKAPATLESYSLAPSELAFWNGAAHPRKLSEAHGGLFQDYLKRVMLHAAPLDAPEDVAWFLASYAREAQARIERADLPGLAAVRSALEDALGLKFEGRPGEHFFRSSLVQTIFYGVFSAWVLWSRQHPPTQSQPPFNWREAAWSLHVPMIRALYEQVATPSKLGPLGLIEILDWTSAALNRVDRAVFFSRFEEGQAVQYFYEPFLRQFDPALRKQLGVWYTPPEIVQYMVARVDRVLREELDLPDGLADPRVYVLDPCCGTGAFLVEVLKRIASTLQQKGADALRSDDVKQAAMHRVFGFEILPAPFVVAHLQLGLLLQNLGAPLSVQSSERAGVYLTNALTGWDHSSGRKQLIFPEMQEEREAAQTVKCDKPVLVVLGNPPYNAFAGVSPQEEHGLVEPYKEGLIARWGIKKFNLDDLYIRFLRLAERRIAEMTGQGVVCFITNHSWLGDPSFVVLREHLLNSFDRFWIENMHGNRKISEYAPDGRTSETIFAIPGFSPGIQQGVAISLWAKTGKRRSRPQVFFRDNINAARAVERRAQLLRTLEQEDFTAHHERAAPGPSNRFSFRPGVVHAEYQKWPRPVDLCVIPPHNGLMEKRGGALIDVDRERLETRMRAFFDTKLEWADYKALGLGLTQPQARFDPRVGRRKALRTEAFARKQLVRYALRPFDVRWCYYTGVRPIWNEPRPSLKAQCWPGNRFLMTRPSGVASPEGAPFFFTRLLGDNDFLRGHAYYFPFQLKNKSRLEKHHEATLFDLLGEPPEQDRPFANLSKAARAYLAGLGVADPDSDSDAAALLWLHTLAIGYSPAYLRENADGIRQDWPRVPLPANVKALVASARLGQQVAALLDSETAVPGITAGVIRPELRTVAVVARLGGGTLKPEAGDLNLSAGWGHLGKNHVTMPGKGRLVKRSYTPEERSAPLGETTNDVFLNDVACWQNVPDKVWGYTIGGYQVLKKWLSYREGAISGRPLTKDEVREVTQMARRIAALLLLTPELDADYENCKQTVASWAGQPSA